jgi:hypothetical protein
MMRSSEPGEGHIKSAPVVPAGVQPVMGRRSLAVMLGGLSLLGPLSIDASYLHSQISSAIFTQATLTCSSH